MRDFSNIFIIKPNGLVTNNDLNNATINDLVIRYYEGTDEIRVICPKIKTNAQIETSCKIINELCIIYEDNDSFSENDNYNIVFAVIADSRKFAIKFPYDSISHNAIHVLNEAFSDYIHNSNEQVHSIIKISPDGNKESIIYHEDIYDIINEGDYKLNDSMRDSLNHYFGQLHDVTKFFDNKTICISSALNANCVNVRYDLDAQPLYCDSRQTTYFTVKITQSQKEYASFLDRQNTYLMCNYDSDNVPIEACVKVHEPDNWEYFKIFSTGEHFALKSVHANKWVSCINGKLTVSCDKQSPDIFSLFDISLVKIEEFGDSMIKIKHLSDNLTHNDICNQNFNNE